MTKSSSAVAPPPILLGFDPGREKCGVAIVTLQGQAQYHEVIPTAQVLDTLQHLNQTHTIQRIILGNQTGSKQWQAQIQQHLNPCPPITLVDERYSSLEARERYWILYPPRGWQRLIPQGLRTPPRPIDDLVAILLVERFLASSPT